eukprot:837604-Rhodomonas_salina.1
MAAVHGQRAVRIRELTLGIKSSLKPLDQLSLQPLAVQPAVLQLHLQIRHLKTQLRMIRSNGAMK